MVTQIINSADGRRLIGEIILDGRKKNVYEVRPEGHVADVAQAVNDASLELIGMLWNSQPRRDDLRTHGRVTLDRNGFHVGDTTLSHDYRLDFKTADHLYARYRVPSEEDGTPPPIDFLSHCINKDLHEALAYCRNPEVLNHYKIAKDADQGILLRNALGLQNKKKREQGVFNYFFPDASEGLKNSNASLEEKIKIYIRQQIEHRNYYELERIGLRNDFPELAEIAEGRPPIERLKKYHLFHKMAYKGTHIWNRLMDLDYLEESMWDYGSNDESSSESGSDFSDTTSVYLSASEEPALPLSTVSRTFVLAPLTAAALSQLPDQSPIEACQGEPSSLASAVPKTFSERDRREAMELFWEGITTRSRSSSIDTLRAPSPDLMTTEGSGEF